MIGMLLQNGEWRSSKADSDAEETRMRLELWGLCAKCSSPVVLFGLKSYSADTTTSLTIMEDQNRRLGLSGIVGVLRRRRRAYLGTHNRICNIAEFQTCIVIVAVVVLLVLGLSLFLCRSYLNPPTE
jgi:hypothetical protein